MNVKLFEEAKHSDVLSKELIASMLESMEYGGISFVNWTIEVLQILRTRIERGDKITDAVSKVVYNRDNFKKFVENNFSTYISSEVFFKQKKPEKVYFTLSECEGGYNLILASSSKNKTYTWISSLSERFSLVYMNATRIVYLKDTRSNSYMPFISGSGKYCRYHEEQGKLIEIQ